MPSVLRIPGDSICLLSDQTLRGRGPFRASPLSALITSPIEWVEPCTVALFWTSTSLSRLQSIWCIVQDGVLYARDFQALEDTAAPVGSIEKFPGPNLT